MNGSLQNMYANSTIACSVFVIPDSTHNNSVKTAVDGTVPISGISQNSARTRPDPGFSQSTQAQQIAAIAGEELGVHPIGSTGVDLVCNFAWSAGDLLMPDGSGFGIEATTGNYYGAQAQTGGVVGALCPVNIQVGYHA